MVGTVLFTESIFVLGGTYHWCCFCWYHIRQWQVLRCWRRKIILRFLIVRQREWPNGEGFTFLSGSLICKPFWILKIYKSRVEWKMVEPILVASSTYCIWLRCNFLWATFQQLDDGKFQWGGQTLGSGGRQHPDLGLNWGKVPHPSSLWSAGILCAFSSGQVTE